MQQGPRESRLVGRQLGHYRILKEIGRGGMGVVCLAEDTHLGRKVALKVLPASIAEDRKRLDRFRREAKALASLSHPGIVTLYSVEEEDSVHFLTMELVEGPTLGDLIREGELTLERCLEIGIALASALQAAHEHGILHRDIKPSNVMIGQGNWVKLLDFGLAKLSPSIELTWADGKMVESALTQEGSAVGTLGYMAPEQLVGRPADERSDLFSLGLVLYEMLTGAAPFAGETSAARVAAVLRDEPTSLRERRGDLPRELVRTVEKCLCKAPEKRFASAAELLEALEEAQRGLEIEKLRRSDPSLARAQRDPKHRLALGGLLAAGFAVVLIGLVWMNRPGEPAGPPESGPGAPALGLLSASAGASASADAVEARPVLAVLPLSNLTGDPEYFVEGMTDALIGSLSRSGTLTVISRQSAMRFRGSSLPLAEIALQLGAEYLVEGTVARTGENVHLQARVVRPSPEEQVWAKVYDRPIEEVFTMHDEIAGSVAAALGVPPATGFVSRANQRNAVDPMAYEAYLKGRYWGSRYSEADLRKSQGYFEQAVAIDDGFARGWAGLAESLLSLAALHSDANETLALAEAAAQRAEQLDPSLPEAHALLGDLSLQRWRWAEAEQRITQALELDSNSAVAQRRYWMLLACQQRFSESRRAVEAAHRLDPLSAPTLANVGIQHLFEGRTEQAERVLLEVLEESPDYALAHAYLWLLYHDQGVDPARGQALAAYLAGFGYAEVAQGVRDRLDQEGYDKALVWAADQVARREDPQGKFSAVAAGLLAASGQSERAMRWLNAAYEGRVWDLAWVGVSLDYASLWSREDFRDLLAQVGVPAPRAAEPASRTASES